MDEVTLYGSLEPEPLADPDAARQRAAARLYAAMAEASPLVPPGPRRLAALRFAALRSAPLRGPGHRRPASGGRPWRLGGRSRGRLLLAGCTSAIAACAAIALPIVLPAGGPARMVSAAWAVQRNHNGTVSIYLSSGGVADPGRLQQVLVGVGVPAQVRPGQLCPPLTAFVPLAPVVQGPYRAAPAASGRISLAHPLEYRITPAKLPRGSWLVITGLRPAGPVTGRASVVFQIVARGQPVICRAAYR